MKAAPLYLFLFILVLTGIGCANIVPPNGGEKDEKPPQLLSLKPADSLLNTRVTRIEMRFDEFVEVRDVAQEVHVSPLLPIPLSVTSTGKRVVTLIPDSLLKDNTTYRISFGNAIQDIHEGNPFSNFTYTFSTGSYFDSLELGGTVINAATGLPDTGSVVMLYDAEESDSVVVRKKPLYIAPVENGGNFRFAGLPDREFRIYALKDANNNLIYDGNEAIGFIDSTVRPADSIDIPITLKVFVEDITDTLTDSLRTKKTVGKKALRSGRTVVTTEGFTYNVAVDTFDVKKRTLDVTKPISIKFNRPVDSINRGRIHLSYDSVGIAIESSFRMEFDTTSEETILLNAKWKENAVYTLRLLTGFARDTSGIDAMPSRYTFRTKSEQDYAKLNIHLPSKYYSTLYVLMVTSDDDTVYQKPVTDTMVRLSRLQPGSYKMRIIVDKNRNGKWDTGNLFEKIQPEVVIPYDDPIQLKAGWDNTIDFEPTNSRKEKRREGAREKRDKP